MKSLVIVESPSKATKIQEYLGNDYVVMACKGHITELAKGGHFGLGVDIENDFKPRYVLSADKISILDDLMNVAKTCDQILLASDNDREGESISWHLQQRLQDMGKPIKRLIFNEIKKSAIQKAIKDAGDINMRAVHSQEARRVLDRLVGFMASPFLMNYYGNNLSAGRVQSVLTRIIIDRENEINQFLPETFYTIQVQLSKDGKEGFETKYSGRPTDASIAEAIYSELASNQQYVVSEVISNQENKYPQPPLVTSTLQRLMSKNHGMSSDRTMKAAQSLYEAGYCTYIRTDSVRVSVEALSEVRQWLQDNQHPLPKKAYVYKNKEASQDAHECIRPSDLNLEPDNYAIIDPDEKLVYETIWRNFVASQAMPAIYSTLKITAHVKGNKSAEVKAAGKALISEGYLNILNVTDDSKIEIPNLVVGDLLSLFGKKPVKLEMKETQPPPRYSEDKLIKELVSKGIGRPATFADLISKVCLRNYVEKHGVVFHATPLGKKITNELCQFFTFMNYDYTSLMEKQLDLIEEGKLEYVEMLKTFYPAFKKELETAYLQHGGSLCQKCGSPMVQRTNKKDGSKFVSCSAYPNCRNTGSAMIQSQVA
jgi:DNA topoisomerase I